MSRDLHAAGAPIADQAIEVALSPAKLLGKGFKTYERYDIEIRGEDGPVHQNRDILRHGRVVAVLPVDLARGEVVVIQQFRLAAHLANGRGNLIEIVAGFVEADEAPAGVARRECLEEIGVEPQALVELFTFLTSPGSSDEEITLFLGIVDSSRIPARAGAAAENESTRPIVLSIDAALAALERHTMRNGTLIVALQWLAINRTRLHEVARQSAVAN
jgi:ADP-ribose pyrophosphatase